MSPGAWIVIGAILLVIAGAALANAASIAAGHPPFGESTASTGSGLALFLENLIGGVLLALGGFLCIQRGRKRLKESAPPPKKE